MDKKKLKFIIQEYLDQSSIYAEKFHKNYKNRLSVEDDDYNISVHGIGMYVSDKRKDIEIDFDYFHYHGESIKYFDPWKLNLYSKKKYNIEFSKELIKQLSEKGYIKKYYKSFYYYVI